MLASDNEGVVWTLKNFSRWLVESIHNFQFNAIFFVRNLPALVLRCLFFSRFYEFLLSFFCCRCRHRRRRRSYNACVFSVWLFSKNFFFYGIFSPLCCICLRIYLLPCYYVHTYTMHIKAIARSQCGWTQEEKKAHTHTESEAQSTHQIYEICISVFYATSLFVLSHSSAYHFSHSPSHSRPFFPTPNTMCASCFFQLLWSIFALCRFWTMKFDTVKKIWFRNPIEN